MKPLSMSALIFCTLISVVSLTACRAANGPKNADGTLRLPPLRIDAEHEHLFTPSVRRLNRLTREFDPGLKERIAAYNRSLTEQLESSTKQPETAGASAEPAKLDSALVASKSALTDTESPASESSAVETEAARTEGVNSEDGTEAEADEIQLVSATDEKTVESSTVEETSLATETSEAVAAVLETLSDWRRALDAALMDAHIAALEHRIAELEAQVKAIQAPSLVVDSQK